MKPCCKSFDSKTEAEKRARYLEAQVDRFGAAPDMRFLKALRWASSLRFASERSCQPNASQSAKLSAHPTTATFATPPPSNSAHIRIASCNIPVTIALSKDG
jgi:hypothetical protein